MNVGTSAMNNRRFIDITVISKVFGTPLNQTLAGFHAFTGSDKTSVFFKKGRNVPSKCSREIRMPKLLAFEEDQ
jgi:hypothetical protein